MEIIKYRKDANSAWQDIAAIKGEKGDPGTDYVLTEADKQEIASMVEVTGGGGEGAEAYYFEGAPGNPDMPITANDKAKMEEIYNSLINNNTVPYEVWMRASANELIKATRYFANSNLFQITAEDNNQRIICSYQMRNGAIYKTNSETNYTIVSTNDWHWTSTYNEFYINDIGNYKHIRIVGYWSGNTSWLSTFDITTSHDNSFYEESGTTYFAVGHCHGTMKHMSFYNDSGNLEIKVNQEANSSTFMPLGYYYWE